MRDLKSLTNKEGYGNLLLKLYTFYVSVEEKLQDQINENIIPDIKKRRHMQHLENDLCLLGVKHNFQKNDFSNKITNVSYALGVLYVTEGSTLGGQIISKMIMKQLNLSDKKLLSYFNSYEDNTHTMWLSFKSHLNNTTFIIDKEEMILGAKDAFLALQNWLLFN
ncbi:biliverdin-producing heme oxygenase [Flavobacterium sp. 9AF]|uniref:biliverdin-producing heme oxygenase n=1 Tax=Flavobacterium sp. 9AF TaxID=2653142 RepID=UPI00351B2114